MAFNVDIERCTEWEEEEGGVKGREDGQSGTVCESNRRLIIGARF